MGVAGVLCLATAAFVVFGRALERRVAFPTAVRWMWAMIVLAALIAIVVLLSLDG